MIGLTIIKGNFSPFVIDSKCDELRIIMINDPVLKDYIDETQEENPGRE